LGIDKSSGLMMLISIMAVVAFALIMRYVVEKPALAVRNKILKKIK
jgi:peptidoglycan/LPS O-acetylase OafA/YrhL